MENLKEIGMNIIKLTIESSTGTNKRLFDVLRLSNNVQVLNISGVEIQQPRYENIEQINFSSLKSLELEGNDEHSSIEGGFLQGAFNKVDSLEHLIINCLRISDWDHFQPLVSRQTNLHSLELSYTRINKFAWKELIALEKLVLKSVTFSQREAFESFTTFIKTPENVSELELNIMNDQQENDYSEILTHLLNLAKLTKLTLYCYDIGSLISGLQVRNPTVKSLTTNQPSVDQFFPNLQQLHIENFLSEMNENVTGRICQNSLTEIVIDEIAFQNLQFFKCPSVKKFSVSRICYYQEVSTALETFAQNNPEIEDLELFKDMYNSSKLPTQHVAQLLNNLPKLRIFKLTSVSFVNSLEVARFIGENIGCLENVELAFVETEDCKVKDYSNRMVLFRTTIRSSNHEYRKVITVEKNQSRLQ
jgi:hypothetical protein